MPKKRPASRISSSGDEALERARLKQAKALAAAKNKKKTSKRSKAKGAKKKIGKNSKEKDKKFDSSSSDES